MAIISTPNVKQQYDSVMDELILFQSPQSFIDESSIDEESLFPTNNFYRNMPSPIPESPDWSEFESDLLSEFDFDTEEEKHEQPINGTESYTRTINIIKDDIYNSCKKHYNNSENIPIQDTNELIDIQLHINREIYERYKIDTHLHPIFIAKQLPKSKKTPLAPIKKPRWNIYCDDNYECDSITPLRKLAT